MQNTRLWISVSVLVIVVIAMFILNSVEMGGKGKPDIHYQGRLSHLNNSSRPSTEAAGTEKPEKKKQVEKPSECDNSNETAQKNTEKPQGAITVKESLTEKEKQTIAGTDGSVVKLETDKGDIYLELYDQKTPIATGNFLQLVNSGFYDNLTFHRVIDDFMVQSGCPKGDGTGGPGFTIPDETDTGLKHKRGSLSMANTGKPHTGGSQFFICHSPQPHLDGKHTVFGECIDGMDVVDSIEKGDKITAAHILKKSPSVEDNVEKAKEARVAE